MSEEEFENSFTFWSNVYFYKNAMGQFAFRELALYMLILLTFPSSNAVVKRAFSIMNCIKTKQRNRMQLELLEAILRIRMRFYSLKICCHNFKPSKELLKDFNSQTMYPNQYEYESEGEIQNSVFQEIQEDLQGFEWPCISIIP